MSDESNEDNESFFSKVSSAGSEYVSLLGQLSGDEDELEVEGDVELSFIERPSSNDIAERAYDEVAREAGGEDNLPFDDPRPVLLEAERQFSMMRDDLIEKIEDIQQKEEESVSGADIDTMLYIIDKNAGKTGKFTLFGGAESLIFNTAEKFGWHQYEAQLVYKSNEIAAQENNLHRHLLLDTVLIVPNSEEVI